MAILRRRHSAVAPSTTGHRGRPGSAANCRAGLRNERSGQMIIARAPLRISLGGGGTDLPSYYREHGGFLIAAAIDKYVYITLHETFVDYLIVKYSETEKVHAVEELKHPLIRE